MLMMLGVFLCVLVYAYIVGAVATAFLFYAFKDILIEREKPIAFVAKNALLWPITIRKIMF